MFSFRDSEWKTLFSNLDLGWEIVSSFRDTQFRCETGIRVESTTFTRITGTSCQWRFSQATLYSRRTFTTRREWGISLRYLRTHRSNATKARRCWSRTNQKKITTWSWWWEPKDTAQQASTTTSKSTVFAIRRSKWPKDWSKDRLGMVLFTCHFKFFIVMVAIYRLLVAVIKLGRIPLWPTGGVNNTLLRRICTHAIFSRACGHCTWPASHAGQGDGVTTPHPEKLPSTQKSDHYWDGASPLNDTNTKVNVFFDSVPCLRGRCQ